MSFSRREALQSVGAAALATGASPALLAGDFGLIKDPAVAAWKVYKRSYMLFAHVDAHDRAAFEAASDAFSQAGVALANAKATTALGVLCKLLLAKELTEPESGYHLDLTVTSLIRDLPEILGESFQEPVWPPVNA